ncbi:MAG: HEAT repeat domain-containing protein [Planctomycetes bacterium]|nr:HEAT repeat domain-containing protein [Planctomycetota bacterium]
MSRRRKAIWLGSILLVLAGGIGGYYLYQQATAIDRKVCELVYEAAGYPDSSMEKRLKEWKLDFMLKEKPKPREDDVIVKDLKAIGNAATPSLISLLNDENDIVRLYAVEFLGCVGDARAVEPLMKVLEKDKDDQVRFASAYSLGDLGDKRAVDLLIQILEKDKVCYAREGAVHALGKLGDTKAVEPLRHSNKT